MLVVTWNVLHRIHAVNWDESVIAKHVDEHARIAAIADWIARRDTACKAEASESEGGSIYPTLLFSCMAEKTKARIRELEAARR